MEVVFGVNNDRGQERKALWGILKNGAPDFCNILKNCAHLLGNFHSAFHGSSVANVGADQLALSHPWPRNPSRDYQSGSTASSSAGGFSSSCSIDFNSTAL